MTKRFTYPLPEGKSVIGVKDAICRYLETIPAKFQIEYQEDHWCIYEITNNMPFTGIWIRLYQQSDQLCMEIGPFWYHGYNGCTFCISFPQTKVAEIVVEIIIGIHSLKIRNVAKKYLKN